MAEIIKLPGAKMHQETPPETHAGVEPKTVLEAMLEEADNLDSVLIVGTRDGQLCWGSSTKSLLEIIWLCRAMDRIAMDHSLGLLDGED